jgi:hypothetical protein
MWLRQATAVLCGLLLASSGFAADAEILGSDYRQLPVEQQSALVDGLWYGVTVWSYHLEYSSGTSVGSSGPQNPENRWLAVCNEGKSAKDMSDLYNQYLDSHPELWHFDVGTLFVLALKEACGV